MKNKLFNKKPILALAPMAGITDSGFRLLCRELGADLVYSEMISADGLVYGKKSWDLAKFDNQERPIVLQLFGKKPEIMAKAAALLCAKLKPEVIDLNMGCPAKKVIHSEHGAMMLKNQPLALEIVRQVKKAVGKKTLVSVKTRLGWDKKTDILTFAPKLEKAGMDFLCLHGRTYVQGFTGEVDYQMIKKVKAKLKVPVLANGGIKTPEDAARVLRITGVDGAAIGMGAWGHPWLFKEIKEYLAGGEYQELSWKEIKKIIYRQATLALKNKGQHGLVELRKHLCWYVKGQKNAAELRQKLVRVETIVEIKRILG